MFALLFFIFCHLQYALTKLCHLHFSGWFPTQAFHFPYPIPLAHVQARWTSLHPPRIRHCFPQLIYSALMRKTKSPPYAGTPPCSPYWRTATAISTPPAVFGLRNQRGPCFESNHGSDVIIRDFGTGTRFSPRDTKLEKSHCGWKGTMSWLWVCSLLHGWRRCLVR